MRLAASLALALLAPPSPGEPASANEGSGLRLELQLIPSTIGAGPGSDARRPFSSTRVTLINASERELLIIDDQADRTPWSLAFREKASGLPVEIRCLRAMCGTMSSSSKKSLHRLAGHGGRVSIKGPSPADALLWLPDGEYEVQAVYWPSPSWEEWIFRPEEERPGELALGLFRSDWTPLTIRRPSGYGGPPLRKTSRGTLEPVCDKGN